MRLFFLMAVPLLVSAADLVISGGAGPSARTTVGTPAGDTVSAPSSGTVMLNLSGRIVNLGAVALGYEVPVAFGGQGRALVFAISGGGETYTEQANLFVTPGARVSFAPGKSLTPWVSYGAGLGRLKRDGANYGLTVNGMQRLARQTGDRRVFAMSVAGGVDWKPVRLVVIRVEARNFTFTTPKVGFVGSFAFRGERRNNLVFLGGVGLRF